MVAVTSKDAKKAFKLAGHSANHSSRQGGAMTKWLESGWMSFEDVTWLFGSRGQLQIGVRKKDF
jgi:hypothetical protein